MGRESFWRALPRVLAGALLAVTVSSALASCGKGGTAAENLVGKADGPAMEKRDAGARRAGEPAPGEFAFTRYYIDVAHDQPRACLAFNKSLDPKKDYAPYLSITPATQTALAVEGANLCIGGLTFGVDREVTIRSGLPDIEGHALAYEENISIEFGDRPSYVGFKGDGVILPRVEADGLGIETVNVEKVKVDVSRITDRSIVFKSISKGFSAAQGSYGYFEDDGDPFQYMQPLWSGTMDIKNVSPNAAKTTVFPISEAVGRLQPGAYFIELHQAGADGKVAERSAEAKRWLIITDLMITTYRGSDGMSATVRSLQNAKPVRSVKLELVARNNEILARGETDAQGHVTFNGAAMRGEGNLSPRMVMAYGANNDFAVLDLDRTPVDLSERDIGGREPARQADAFIYTERGVYRPGETVYATSLIRDSAANAIANRAGSLVVYSPNGLESSRQRFDKAPQAGGLSYAFAVPKTAARGQWRMVALVDGIGDVGSTSFSVEDFVPQRIALDLKVDKDKPMTAGEKRPLTANVRFLYGAPGAGLPVESNVRAEVDPSPFKDLPGFQIGRHNEEFREIAFDLPATVADGAGNATLILDPSTARPESSKPLRLHAVVSAIEPGGRAVRDDVRIPYRPNDRYLGIKPKFEDSAKENEQAEFEMVAVDRASALKAAEVNWKLVRIDWKYDWYRADGGAWQWRHTREVVQVEDGVARFNDGQRGSIKTSHRLAWGNYDLMLTDTKTGAEASTSFYVGWGGGSTDGGVEAPDRVRLSVPDKLPAPGGEIEIGVLPPYSGEAEIVVASDNVITTRTLQVKAEGTRIKLPVTKEWGAGVYVMASVYTPRDPVERPKPRRAVGVAHVAVDVAPRTFTLTLKAPQVQRPRTKLNVEVQATTGPRNEDAYVTVAAVDEGILLLTGFKSPSATDYFFGKRRLGVDLRDDYGRLLDPNMGAAAGVQRFGGDQIGGAGLTVVPTKSVALYSGVVKLDKSGRAVVPIDVPDFNGELRLMAVAWSATGLGQASQPLTVRDPVTAELILPRFLAPGDEATATITMDNVEGAAGAYTAKLAGTAPVAAANGQVSAQLAAKARQDLPAIFRASAEGISTLSLNVTGPNFNVGRAYPIQSRSPWLPASSVVRKILQPGETWRPDPGALASYVPGSSSMQVSFSPLPMDPAALYDSLDKYPYGCTEQIVSRAMPLLYAQNMASLAGRKPQGDIKNSVQEAISTLLNRQSADGAIGLWRIGDHEATPWLGAYAVDFLARAKTAGYVVPDAAMDKAYDALESFAVRDATYGSDYDFDIYESRWNPDTKQLLLDRSTAYAAYVLAKANRMDKARLRYLHDERLKRYPGGLAKAQLGAALYMIGDQARSASAFNAAEQSLGYRNQGDYYQTERRDLAGVLALASEAKMADRVKRLSEQVGRDLPEPDRLTTQEKSFLLLAASALSGGEAQINVGVQGQASTISAGRVFGLSEAQSKTPPTFTNTTRTPLWLTAISRGAPASAPPTASEGVDLSKQLFYTDGRPATATNFAQGDRLIVAIRVASQSERITPLVIADLLPAGFEIETTLHPADGGNTGAYSFLGQIAEPKIAEARDDRYVAAIDLYDRNAAKVAYIVRAVTPGSFAAPGANAEDMYRPDVFARSESKRITVAKK